MATKTWYILDAAASGSSHGSLSETNPGNFPQTVSSTGWLQSVTPAGYSLMAYGSEQGVITFGATAQPASTPSTSDCWRTQNAYNGVFYPGNWTVDIQLNSDVAANDNGQGNVTWRLWRSQSATGANAVELTSGIVTGSFVSGFNSTSSEGSTVTVLLPKVRLNNEYLFLQLAYQITTPATAATCTAYVITWTQCQVSSPEFAPGVPPTADTVSANAVVVATTPTSTGWRGADGALLPPAMSFAATPSASSFPPSSDPIVPAPFAASDPAWTRVWWGWDLLVAGAQHTLSASANAIVQAQESISASGNAVVQAARSDTATANAVVQAARSLSASANAVVQAPSTLTAMANAIVQGQRSDTATANAVIQGARSISASANTVVQAHSSLSASGNAVVQNAQSIAAIANAVIQAARSASASGSAIVQGREGVAANGNAVVQGASSISCNASAVVQGAGSLSASANAVVSGGSTHQSITAEADAVVAETITLTATANAIFVNPTGGTGTGSIVELDFQTLAVDEQEHSIAVTMDESPSPLGFVSEDRTPSVSAGEESSAIVTIREGA